MSAPTYEKTVEYHKLSSSQVQAECPDDVLHSLAKKMNRWQSIAVDLEMDRIVVDAIENEKIDEEGKARKLLERWKESFGHEATFERLTRCLIRSKRADLADLVCEECKKCAPCPEVDSESVVPPAPTDCHVFTTQATGEEAGRSDRRDIPVKKQAVETIGRDEVRQPGSLKYCQSTDSINLDPTSEQEQSNGHQSSDMVTNATNPPTDPLRSPTPPLDSPRTPGSPMTPSLIYTKMWPSTFDKMVLSITRDKDYMAKCLEKKKEKMRKLKERKQKVEEYLVEKEGEIKRLEDEAKHMKTRLSREQDKQQEVEEDLIEKKQKIEILQGYVFQKDRELKEVKDDRREKCDKLARLEKQLKEAHDKLLEAENDAKDDMEKQLTEVSERYEELQREVKKADNEVDTTRKERETLEDVLRWADSDMEEEEEENELLNYELKQQKKLTKIYRNTTIIFAVLLAIVLLIGTSHLTHYTLLAHIL